MAKLNRRVDFRNNDIQYPASLLSSLTNIQEDIARPAFPWSIQTLKRFFSLNDRRTSRGAGKNMSECLREALSPVVSRASTLSNQILGM